MEALTELTREQALILFPSLELPENANNIPLLHFFNVSSNDIPEEGYCAVSPYGSVTYETTDMWETDDLILSQEDIIQKLIDDPEDEIPELDSLTYRGDDKDYNEQVLAVLLKQYGTLEKAFEANKMYAKVHTKAPYILISA